MDFKGPLGICCLVLTVCICVSTLSSDDAEYEESAEIQIEDILNRIYFQGLEIARMEEANKVMWSFDTIFGRNFEEKYTIHRDYKILLAVLDEWRATINPLSMQHMQMQMFAECSDVLDIDDLIDFAEYTVSLEPKSVRTKLDKLNSFVRVAVDYRFQSIGVLGFMANQLKTLYKNSVCVTQQSAQMVLFHLYITIMLTHLKGFRMLESSWMLLHAYGKGNFTTDIELARTQYEERTNLHRILIKTAMTAADRQVWRCDPDEPEEGKTFEQLTFIRGYIENEINISPGNTCLRYCSYYTSTKQYGCRKGWLCGKQPICAGTIRECKVMDWMFFVCLSKSSSKRRYEFTKIGTESNGNNDRCYSERIIKARFWKSWLVDCDYCICLCEEAEGDKYFSLREAISNVEQNYVVTGLRFRKINGIIHLQIQEGKLLNPGVIDANSLHWVPIDGFRRTDDGVRDGIDYHTLSWESRRINMDDLEGQGDHVVTGVKMRLMGNNLILSVRITKANFGSDDLLDWNWKWISKVSGGRTPLKLFRPGVPSSITEQSLPDTLPNQYIEFTNSDFYVDLWQTTVPFFDVQDVVSIPPVPLSGIGIYHKGLPNFGGYLAPKLITKDFAQDFKALEDAEFEAK